MQTEWSLASSGVGRAETVSGGGRGACTTSMFKPLPYAPAISGRFPPCKFRVTPGVECHGRPEGLRYDGPAGELDGASYVAQAFRPAVPTQALRPAAQPYSVRPGALPVS